MANEREIIRIKDINADNRPRERLALEGAQALSDAELLAILLRVGMRGINAVDLGQQILKKFINLSGVQRAPISELCKIPGIGKAKAIQIKAAVELGNRLSKEQRREKKVISKPEDAIDLVGYELRGREQEELWIVLLDTRNNWIGTDELYKGSLTSSSIRIGELFKTAIRLPARSIIIFHNHPSMDPLESPEDVALTRAAIQAGKLVDIEVLDHIIIAGNEHNSIRRKHPDLWIA
jgi:DNA repair protein RadC